MAKKVDPVLCGIDTSKHTLDISVDDSNHVIEIVNSPESVQAWLHETNEHLTIAIEATGTYHEELVEQALSLGHTVYLINAKHLKHYREAVGGRAKTDVTDALLLRRYLINEKEQLRPLSLQKAEEKRLWRLLKRRGTVVKIRQKLKLSCEGMDGLTETFDQLIAQVNHTLKVIDKELRRLAKVLEWQPMLDRVQTMPGIGPLNALALTACYHRGEFRSVDAFIAFLGLDVRIKDSGTLKGKRKLTKQGEPEIRRLLYNAAMSFDRNPNYRGYRESLMTRGLSSTASYVIIGRKLARVAFTLMRKNVEFDPKIFRIPCAAT